MDYAKKVRNIEKLEKTVTDLYKKFGNIADEFKKVSEELKETKEEISRIRAKNLDINARLTKTGNSDQQRRPMLPP